MKIKYNLIILFYLFHCYFVLGQNNSTKVALVIGAQAYVSSPLKNSLKDAHDMAIALKSLNFQVIELYDPKNKKEIKEGVLKYFDLIAKTKGATGLIYYSGHGMQLDGVNYLVPTTANPQVKADVEEECLRLDYLMAVLEQSGNSLNIVILDACRNNPFRGFSRSDDKGLSMVNAPKGSYIVYATKPGSVASDGTGSNGLFTSKLLKHIREPNLKLWEVFQRVAQDVSIESADSQRPWIASDFTGDFYFNESQTTTNIKKTEMTYIDEKIPALDSKEEINQNTSTPSTLPSDTKTIDYSTVNAAVFIYRPYIYSGLAVKCEVSLDSKYIGNLSNKGRMQINNLKYGLYKLTFKYSGTTKSIDVLVQNSNEIYIRWVTTSGPSLVDQISGKTSWTALDKPILIVNH